MTNKVRRVGNDYLSLEKIIKRKYIKVFHKIPSQTLISNIIGKLVINKRITMTKNKRKVNYILK